MHTWPYTLRGNEQGTLKQPIHTLRRNEQGTLKQPIHT